MTIDCPRIVSVNYLNDTNLSPVDHNGFKMTDTTGGFSALSVDGTVVSVGDLLLLINQTNEEENGLWQIVQQGNSLDTPWQLCRVHPGGKLFVGMLFFIKSGTDWANTMWCLSQAQENATDVEVITSGVSLLTFTQVCVNKPSGSGCSPINSLIDNTGATATDLVVNVGNAVSGVDGTGNNAASLVDVNSRLTLINNNFADLVAKVNAILTCLRDQNILNTP
jgi:hypothetical protein